MNGLNSNLAFLYYKVNISFLILFVLCLSIYKCDMCLLFHTKPITASANIYATVEEQST